MGKTAVDWLCKELESYGDPQFCEIEWKQLDSLIEQAKEMDKKQKMETYFAAIKSTGEGWNGEYAGTNFFSIEETFNGDFQKYYNETFEK
jgi:hypothetical protein